MLTVATLASCADDPGPRMSGLAVVETRPDLVSPVGRFVLIPAGRGFVGGYLSTSWPKEKVDFHAADQPEIYPNSWVTITRPFWLQSTEVTRGEWLELMPDHKAGTLVCDQECPPASGVATLYRNARDLPPGTHECEATCPASFVGWIDAVYYADRRSVAEGRPVCYHADACGPWLPQIDSPSQIACLRSLKQNLDCEGYRVPGTYEWEYAARSGGAYTDNEPDYIFPDHFEKPYHAEDCEWDRFTSGDHLKPVAQLCETIWGAYDLAKNVQEVVWDRPHWYTAEDKVDPVFDPTPDRPLNWDVRAGSNWYASGAHVTRRTFVWYGPEFDHGLRLVRTASCAELKALKLEIPETMAARCAPNEGSATPTP